LGGGGGREVDKDRGGGVHSSNTFGFRWLDYVVNEQQNAEGFMQGIGRQGWEGGGKRK